MSFPFRALLECASLKGVSLLHSLSFKIRKEEVEEALENGDEHSKAPLWRALKAKEVLAQCPPAQGSTLLTGLRSETALDGSTLLQEYMNSLEEA